MFGLTFEKLVVVGLIAAVIIGPQRLPGVVAWIASLVRGLRRTVDAARLRAASELGVPVDAAQWHALDPRQYDPRRIIAEVLAAPSAGARAVPSETAAAPSAGAPAAPWADTLAAPSTEALDARSAVIAGATAPGHAPDSSGVLRDDVSVPVEHVPGAVTSRASAGGAPAGRRRVRVGTSAHPRWIEVADEAPTVPPSPNDSVESERVLLSEPLGRAPITEVTTRGTCVAPPPPAPVETASGGDGCDSVYADACVPVDSDVDCAGGKGNGPSSFDGVARVVGTDIHKLDGDGDGFACNGSR